MSRLKHLWHNHRIALIGFVLASALALGFALRILVLTIYWANPEHHRQDPEPWMTAGYIVRSWHVSREDLDAVLGVERVGRVRLIDIAQRTGKPVDQLIEELRVALPQMPKRPEKQ